ERTILEWLKKLGWSYKKWKKNIYVDGHEQEDIVQYRQEVFLPMMAELELLLIEYDKNDLILVKKIFLLIKNRPGGEQKLRPKGRDRYIYVSEFLCKPLRRVYLT
ncbi:9460_t:CDS:2, partial [Racocetra persica]